MENKTVNWRVVIGILLIISIFVIGFFTSQISLSLNPKIQNFNISAPSDFIKEKQIKIYDNKIVINISNIILSKFKDTGSMIPTLDKGANGMYIKPKSEEEVKVGDIVSFKKKDYLVAHRVVYKGIDEQGVYFITKGDKNNVIDDKKLRFRDIQGIMVGILY